MDSVPANRRFSEDIQVTFPLLSDFQRNVSKEYGIINEERGTAIRTTYVIDKQGIIRNIEQGSVAIDPSGAAQICSLLK